MCEKRTKRLKRGSQITRMREERRLQRLRWLNSPVNNVVSSYSPAPQPIFVDKTARNRFLIELAWKTIALMHKNKLIQQKIADLQKETLEFVTSVMNNPENRKRYMEHIRLYGNPQPQSIENNNPPVKVEPE